MDLGTVERSSQKFEIPLQRQRERMAQPEALSCEELIQPIQNGCQKSYESLLRATVHILKSYLIRYLANNDEIQDVIQEVLLSVHRSLASYQPDRPYRPWVLAIARHRLNDYFRVRYANHVDKWVGLAELLWVQDPPQELVDSRFEGIQLYLQELPERQRRILFLMHYQGYTAREVGNQFGMSEAAVKISAHRAYEKVRKRVSGL